MSNLNRTSKHLPCIALLSGTLMLLLMLSSCGVAESATTSLPTAVVVSPVITAAPEVTSVHLSDTSGNEKPTVELPQKLTPIATAIASAGKDMNENINQHMLDSSTPLVTVASQAGADLESLLFQPGDLPDGIAASHADYPSPINFEDNPPAATMVGLNLTKEGRGAGRVSVLLYTSPSDLSNAFARLTSSVLSDERTAGNKPQPKPAIGEQAQAAQLTLASSTYGKDTVSVVIFTRCHALIDIRLNEWAGMTMQIATAFATAVDNRLTPKVCQ